MSDWRLNLTIVEKDAATRIVGGWAYVAKRPDGTQVIDHSDEFIDDLPMLEKALRDLFKAARERACDVMHDGHPVGGLVGGVVFTTEKLAAMSKHFGDPITGMPLGAWVEMEIAEEIYKRVASGELGMFSIAGHADREEIAA